MAKICLRTVLHNKTEEKFFNSEVNAILDKNRIKYLDKDVTVILELEENTKIIENKKLISGDRYVI